MSIDMLKSIRERRSIRRFKRKSVNENAIERLIDAARWAPSAGNLQPWEFVVIRTPETKKKLAEAALEQSILEEAPVTIIICADEQRSAQRYGERGRTLYCLQDTAAAAQNIHLAAHSLGLATCWVGAFDENKVAKIIAAPPQVRPIIMIPIGYAAESPEPRRRRSVEEIMHQEKY